MATCRSSLSSACLVLLLMAAVSLEAAVIIASGTSLLPELRCPDGRIPLNSPQQRCRSLPQLQWSGRRCQNDSVDFGCPGGFNCLAEGICCESPQDFRYPNDNLCRLSAAGSKAVDTVGTCVTDSDCKSYDSRAPSRCCSGSCVLLMQRCFKQRRMFLNIQSTGKMPRVYLPNCTEDGAFAPIQWEPRFNRRWCVDQRTGLALRSGCCLPDAPAGRNCSNPRPCPTDLCTLSVCPARPDAACRVNACDTDCAVEFVDPVSGRPVDCGAGLSSCQSGEAAYFDGLKYLRARDQTQWVQTDAANTPANADKNLAALLDTCQPDVCQAYDASKLESSGTTSTGWECPKQDRLNYRCRDRCGIYGCQSSRQVCCNSGCGLECMTVADMKPESQCSMSISSGHCPAVGCFKMCRRWGYDTAKKTCRPFWFAGSGGNNNRYNSWAECEWFAQNCHGRVLIALPVRPRCQQGGEFRSVQSSDNGMFWCVNRLGAPTPGTLHADSIMCSDDGQLMKNKYYNKVAYLYQGRCKNGAWPAWCHNRTIDQTCGTPGVTTFADACDNCRLVHINADGAEVACQSDSTVCAASTIAAAASPGSVTCQPAPTSPIFRYSSASGQCSAGCPMSSASGYSREAGCLAACAKGWCGRNATAFNPDLCVDPTCAPWPGALCVPDECAGIERYFLPNGTELVGCARQLAPLPSDVCSARTETTVAKTTLKTTATAEPVPATSSKTTPAAGGATSVSRASATASPSASASTTRVASVNTAQSATSTATQRAMTQGAPAASTPANTEKVASPTTVAVSTAQTLTSTPTTAPAVTTPTSTPTTTTPPPKKILPICLIRYQLGLESMRCRSSDGRYEPRQCNLTHCFCVVTDSGAILQQPETVPVANESTLACPIVETTNLSLTITYDADYMTVLPTMNEEEQLQRVVASRYAYEGGLQVKHIGSVDLEPGSILVTVSMQKVPGDTTVDLPASAFELKTMALKQTLTIDFNGITLTPSARQSFNENWGRSVLQPPTEAALTAGKTVISIGGGGSGANSSEMNVAAIVAGVLITVAVVAVAAVLIAFLIRRRRSGSEAMANEASNYVYETMSNASSSVGSHHAYDNFANKVYGPADEDVYDNIAQPASSA